jgi:hypothetical protein
MGLGDTSQLKSSHFWWVIYSLNAVYRLNAGGPQGILSLAFDIVESNMVTCVGKTQIPS